MMKLKYWLRYPLDIHRANKILAARPADAPPSNQRPVVLDLYTTQMLFDCGRHLTAIAYDAGQIGSALYLRCDRLMLAAICHKPLGAAMLKMPNVQWRGAGEALPPNALLLTDMATNPGDRPFDGQQATQMLIGRDICDDCPVMPYPMHPASAEYADPVSLRSHRGNATRSGILFAGNQKPKYGDAKIERNFGMLSRLSILDCLRNQFADRVSTQPQHTQPQHSSDRRSTATPIYLLDSRQHAIAAAQWLPTLAQHRFFVCCPGADQPICHNLIEAMSVGTIPLIEYDDRLRPGLQDGVNAICFRGEQGLREAIERIDQLSHAQLDQMAVNVAASYDEYYCGRKFLKELRDRADHRSVSAICMPFHSRNLYRPVTTWTVPSKLTGSSATERAA